MKDLKQKRKDNVKVRLTRLVRLRQIDAPYWVIKSEQIALVLNASGRKHSGIGKTPSKCQASLYEKYVAPYMGNE
jgi:hypothetical protein